MASEEIMIYGAKSCSGSIQISGSKNAALPELAACLLTNQPVTLKNVPGITDIELMKEQLHSYGVTVSGSGSTLTLKANNAKCSPSNDNGSKTRGSFLVLGALLARFQKAKVYRPGGCQIVKGGRPVDFHIEALKAMGAEDESRGNYVLLKAEKPLEGTRIRIKKNSVGATENTVMAACLAVGRTVITGAAMEPEVMDLVKMLRQMGATIVVHKDRNAIVVDGTNGALLSGCTHTVIPDRIEAGTWAIAAAITGGSLLLKMDPAIGEEIMTPVIGMLMQAGVYIEWKGNGLEVQRFGQIKPVSVITGPFPQFPTDLLPQWVTFMTLATGPSNIQDTIYDNRFGHVPELQKMGANITKISDSYYKVQGNAKLRGKQITAKDLRGGVALILASLVAEGTTIVNEFQHVLRGYEDIKGKLKIWGVKFTMSQKSRSGFHGGHY